MLPATVKTCQICLQVMRIHTVVWMRWTVRTARVPRPALPGWATLAQTGAPAVTQLLLALPRRVTRRHPNHLQLVADPDRSGGPNTGSGEKW